MKIISPPLEIVNLSCTNPDNYLQTKSRKLIACCHILEKIFNFPKDKLNYTYWLEVETQQPRGSRWWPFWWDNFHYADAERNIEPPVDCNLEWQELCDEAVYMLRDCLGHRDQPVKLYLSLYYREDKERKI